MPWEVTLSVRSSECPFYEEDKPFNYRCGNKKNETSWRIINGICQKEFCPGKVGD